MKRFLAYLLAITMIISFIPASVHALSDPSVLVKQAALTDGKLTMEVDLQGINASSFFFSIKFKDEDVKLVDSNGNHIDETYIQNHTVSDISTELSLNSAIVPVKYNISQSGGYSEFAFSWYSLEGVNASSADVTMLTLVFELVGGRISALDQTTMLVGTDADLWENEHGVTQREPILIADAITDDEFIGLLEAPIYFQYKNSNQAIGTSDFVLTPSGDGVIPSEGYKASGYGTYDFTVGTNGVGDITEVTATLSGDDFEFITSPDTLLLQNGTTVPCSVALKDGTPAGTYSTTITFDGLDNIGDQIQPYSIIVSQTITKMDQALLSELTVDSYLAYSITVNPVTGGSGTGNYLYAISETDSTAGLSWQTATTFIGLHSNTLYYLYAMRQGDQNYNNSEIKSTTQTTLESGNYRVYGKVVGKEGTSDVTIEIKNLENETIYNATATFVNDYEFYYDLPKLNATYGVSISLSGYLPYHGSFAVNSDNFSLGDLNVYAGEFRLDNSINVLDISKLIDYYGDLPTGAAQKFDLDENGFINASDIGIIIGNFGRRGIV